MEDKKKRSIWNLASWLEGDTVVWIIVMMLILISIVCIFSSTSRLLEGDQTRIDIIRRQLKVVVAGVAVILLCFSIKKEKIFKWFSKWGFIASALMLVFLDMHDIIGAVGPVKPVKINEAWRIIQIGSIQIHIFEVIKVLMVMYLAWAMDAFRLKEFRWPNNRLGQKWLYIYGPFLFIFLFTIPGSNTAALFIGAVMFITILLGGGNVKDMLLLLVTGSLILGACFGIYDMTKDSPNPKMVRIGTAMGRLFDDKDYETIYLDQSNSREERQEAIDKIRQPYGAKIAIKEGGILGKGPGQSTQRYMVPDMAEDYMFSFIIEEYGLLGGILVILLYVSLLARSSIIARNCGDDLYAKLVVAGLSLLITGQAFLHMFVNADIGPMTGQTLPMISHGNSAFLCFSLAFGVLLSLSRTAAKNMEEAQRKAIPLMEIDDDIKNYGV
ncbi:MAG: FtsW/RodA/SpoVE family cell cycle protein [Bacteroidales bacterium]|nr:FtsW/RodA/SpoVE family cell cycle protein [Bacteroidales bacterium]